MHSFLKKFLASETVSWEFIPLLTPKNQPISETILNYALRINAKIIISSTKSSGQVFGSLENRYEVGGTSNDLLRNNTTGIPVIIVPMKGRFYDELFRNNRTIDYRNGFLRLSKPEKMQMRSILKKSNCENEEMQFILTKINKS